MNIISLGAGVQSSTMALMAAHGELPRPDCAIFADTQWEPKQVYEHLDWLEKQLPFPVYRVSSGNIREDAVHNHVERANGKQRFQLFLGFYLTGEWGGGSVPMIIKYNPFIKRCVHCWVTNPGNAFQ